MKKMAQAQTAPAHPIFHVPAGDQGYRHAIIAMAVQALDGEIITTRVASLAREFDLSPVSVQAEVDEAIDVLKD
jgi:hypothetical protein